MGIRAVLDTNVLVSSEAFGGAPRRVVDAARRGDFTLVLSLHILREFRAVSQAKIGLPRELVSAFIEEMFRLADVLPVLEASASWCDDPADDAVIETALDGRADYLVTGDARLLTTDVPGVRLLTVAEFLRVLGDRG